MIEWLVANKQWLFSGIGLLVLAALWRVLASSFARWRLARALPQPPTFGTLEYKHLSSKPATAYLPGLLLKILYSPERVSQRIRIGLRESTPFSRYLENSIPQIELYLQITNLSPLDLVLDRLVVEVWFGQPAFTASSLRRQYVPAGEITEGITIRQMLTAEQKAFINAFYAAPMGGQIHLYITGYFDSKVGTLAVERSVDIARL